eukprot:scaffold109336_cov16-Prasinocladus_malaysianus.AAC.1
MVRCVTNAVFTDNILPLRIAMNDPKTNRREIDAWRVIIDFLRQAQFQQRGSGLSTGYLRPLLHVEGCRSNMIMYPRRATVIETLRKGRNDEQMTLIDEMTSEPRTRKRLAKVEIYK